MFAVCCGIVSSNLLLFFTFKFYLETSAKLLLAVPLVSLLYTVHVFHIALYLNVQSGPLVYIPVNKYK